MGFFDLFKRTPAPPPTAGAPPSPPAKAPEPTPPYRMVLESARAIASAQWPALRFLEVWYGDPAYGGDSTLGDVRLLLARRDLPALVHLGLQNAAHTDEFCGELGESPLAAQLVELDLSMGTMSDAGARTLAASAAAFPRLEELDVSQNYLSRTAIALLRKAFREVVANEQNEADGDDRHPTVGE